MRFRLLAASILGFIVAGCHRSEDSEAQRACLRVASLCGGTTSANEVDECVQDFHRMRSTVGNEATDSTLRCISSSTSCANATGCATAGVFGGATIEFARGFARAIAPMLPSPPNIGFPGMPPAAPAPGRPGATAPPPAPSFPALPAMPNVPLFPRMPTTVVLRVTGAAHDVDVRFTVGTSSSEVHITQLPWEQTISNPSGSPVQTLSARTNEEGVSLSCEILADGTPRAQATTSGGMMRSAECVAMPPMPGFGP